jgi:hypothetical protein
MGDDSSIRREADWRHRAHLADTQCGTIALCLTSVIMSRADRFVHDLPSSLNLSHIWTHPALQGQCLLMAVRGTTACIYPASFLEGHCPLRHDGICALPPQHFDDLTMVFVITRLRKSRSDLSRHQDILPYATVWKGLYSVNTCALPLLCSPQAFSCRCAPTALWSR